MKTIKYLLIILFCSCATLLYSQVESTYYDAELSSDSIEMVANSLREQIDQWKQKVKENPKDEKALMKTGTSSMMSVSRWSAVGSRRKPRYGSLSSILCGQSSSMKEHSIL